MNAITEPKKAVGRALAVYFYYKFVKGVNYIWTKWGREYLVEFIRTWLRDYVSRDVIEQIRNLQPSDIYSFIQDSQVIDAMRRRSPSNGETHRGFFESRKLAESLILSKEDISNKINELKNEFPERFEGASDSDLKNTLKQISIDYLDGCTDLVFQNGTDENIVDITDNSTNVTEQPEYKALMSNVFENVIDEWLHDHNLTHKDIVWFEYDPETNQMFVEFDANGVNFEEPENMELVPDHTAEQEEDDEELEEALTRDALTKLEQTLYKELNDNEIWVEDIWFEQNELQPNYLNLTISVDGDWKHDHLFCDNIVERFAERNNFKILSEDEQVTKDTGRDDYPAIHFYVFQVPEDQVNEDLIDETYSDEELDKMIGKTYNQQKILNIYRRQKYNDKRLFAHTRCVSCGREKRLFLSNLINDPDKYGSCVCSDTNVKSRLDNIEDLFDGSKKLSNNTSGYTGVSYVKTYKGKLYDKWRAYIEVDGQRTYLGDFDSKSAAIRARKKAAEKGIKWYKEHKNEFMKNYRRKSKRYRSKK